MSEGLLWPIGLPSDRVLIERRCACGLPVSAHRGLGKVTAPRCSGWRPDGFVEIGFGRLRPVVRAA